MMCLTSADALSRYAFNRPILGAFEITEKYLMVAAIFMGLSYGYRGGLFIRVTFWSTGCPAGAARGRLFRLPGDAGVLRVHPVGHRRPGLARACTKTPSSSTLPILVGPAYCLVPFGFLALTVLMLVDLPRVRRRQSLLFTQEAPTAS